MKKTIKAEGVKTTPKTTNWRGITDEEGIFYTTTNPEFIRFIVVGGTYEIEYEEKEITKGQNKGKTQNKITDLRILTAVEQEEQGEVVAQGGNIKGGTTSPLVPVTEKHEVAPVQQRPATVKDHLFPLIPTVGTIDITDAQKGILYAPVNKEDVEIRPDGLIYLPWMEYVTRLKDAFGVGWGIIPDGAPRREGIYILWGFYMVIKGKLAGYAIGEQKYQPNNPQMTWGDACEGAKSNALMRLCKGLGISLELWNPKFIKEWIEEYAESYMDNGKKRWRKKK